MTQVFLSLFFTAKLGNLESISYSHRYISNGTSA